MNSSLHVQLPVKKKYMRYITINLKLLYIPFRKCLLSFVQSYLVRLITSYIKLDIWSEANICQHVCIAAYQSSPWMYNFKSRNYDQLIYNHWFDTSTDKLFSPKPASGVHTFHTSIYDVLVYNHCVNITAGGDVLHECIISEEVCVEIIYQRKKIDMIITLTNLFTKIYKNLIFIYKYCILGIERLFMN